MTIGIDAHNLEGNRTGVGRYLFSLLKEWARLQTTKNESQITKFKLYFKEEIPAELPKSDNFENKLLNVSSTAKFIHWDLCRRAKKDKVDILFCPGYVAPIFYRGKIALVLHDIIYETHPEWFSWKSPADKIILKWASKFSARRAKVILTPSEFSRQEIIKHYHVAPNKVIFFPDAAEIGTGEDSGNIDEIKARYGIKDKFAFFVGSIFVRRHIPEVISAFCRMAKDRPEFQFFLSSRDHTNPPQDIDGLIKKINKELGREVVLRVDFIPEKDLKLLYSACAFFVWLSDYEGFGLPVLEAMSLGAPVITSDKTSLVEVAGDAAMIVQDNSSVDEIYQAMKRLVYNDSFRMQLAEKGREQAKKFSWERCAEETLSALMRA